ANEAPPANKPRPSLPPPSQDELKSALRSVIQRPAADRLFFVGDALRAGISSDEVTELTGIDPWWMAQFERIVKHEEVLRQASELNESLLRESKRLGFGDAQIADLRGISEDDVRALRHKLSIRATFAR